MKKEPRRARSKGGRVWAWFFSVCAVLSVAGLAQETKRRMVHEGIVVELEIQPGPLREGHEVTFRFSITDAATGTGVTGVRPAAWMDLRRTDETRDCAKKIAAFLSGGLTARPALDLNAYYVLALNHDATITVVDPLFHFGGTKLLALVGLKSRGDDWALTSDQSRLFVSLPEANQVAVVDTTSWKVIANIDAGPRPTRLALQPDEQYLWVAYGSAGASGVTALTASGLKVAARIPTGSGAHELAFSDDQLLTFVTNRDEGTVSVIDVRSLRQVKEIKTGRRPVSIAFSRLSQAAYVTDEEDGTITVIDRARLETVATARAQSGLGPIRFAPGDRLGFVVNPKKNAVSILDTANNQVIQTADVGRRPDQIIFSDRLAYVLSRESEFVSMIPLDQVGAAGRPVPVLEFPGGRAPLGETAWPSPAGAIVRAPAPNAIIVANPADKTIYYYQEGMAAPMGNFSNYQREPRAVLVVDRSLRERARGVYETVAKLSRPGSYDVAFMLAAPRVVHCFEVSVAANPETAGRSALGAVEVELLTTERVIRVGEGARLRFRLVDARAQAARVGAGDIHALVFLAPGIWQHRQTARETAEGIYEIEFVPPQPGVYYVYLSSPSAGLSGNRSHLLTLEAR